MNNLNRRRRNRRKAERKKIRQPKPLSRKSIPVQVLELIMELGAVFPHHVTSRITYDGRTTRRVLRKLRHFGLINAELMRDGKTLITGYGLKPHSAQTL